MKITNHHNPSFKKCTCNILEKLDLLRPIKRSKAKLLFSALAAFALAGLPIHADTETDIILDGTNTIDARVDSRGANASMSIVDAFLTVGHADNSQNNITNSYLEINLAGLPTNVTSATLELWRVGGDALAGDAPVNVTAVTSAWTESTLTYLNQPTNAGTPLTSSEIGAKGAYYSFDITSIYNQWAAGTLANDGLLFTSNPLTVKESYDFYSTRGADAPILVLTTAAVPEPSVGMLLGAGLMGLLVLMRRKQRVYSV